MTHMMANAWVWDRIYGRISSLVGIFPALPHAYKETLYKTTVPSYYEAIIIILNINSLLNSNNFRR